MLFNLDLTKVSEYINGAKISVYPNPASEVLYINLIYWMLVSIYEFISQKTIGRNKIGFCLKRNIHLGLSIRNLLLEILRRN